MSLLCRLGIHARYRADEQDALRHDLYWCRRCPAQWRIGGYAYAWGTVRYRDRIADRTRPQEADRA